ncbi:NHL repeat-containing protein [Mytilinidion resinicola]|uniref:NHL repeat-containing protein n=1 Tax=Mytilinidion resinicola TaxID=574789 RepID=A0A6A6YFD0_9PEZI|nr:NHL repeat-containing protein [Mytilinidion resinicola]KAF2807536.1 NHL repeat-containing protein [Mytilinidion resinicola]
MLRVELWVWNLWQSQSHNNTVRSWAWLSYENLSFAVLPGKFNRSVFDAPAKAEVSDERLAVLNEKLNSTDFVVYDEKFFDIVGPQAKVEHVQALAFRSHEAPCMVPGTNDLFFVEWGPSGNNTDGVHDWQYLLNTKTNELRKITTSPPTINVHGCVPFNGFIYVVTDGGPDETGYLAKIDPKTWKRTTLINHYYEEPFGGFNDLAIDPDSNFYLTDSRSGWGKGIVPFTPPQNPSTYFVNGTTMRPKLLQTTTGNANGVAISPDGRTLYLPDTGVSQYYPVKKNPYGARELWAYDFATASSGAKCPTLTNKRLLNNPITYFYDGIRVSNEGWIFCGAGHGVDIIDPETGLALGSIRVGGGKNVAVSLAFGFHEFWIVGQGGVWHVSGIKPALTTK